MRLNNLDLNKLATFLQVVEAGGVSKAGAQLGRSASAVSQSLSALEASLGVQLFDRVRKTLVLTRAGQLLHERVAGYQALLAQTVGELAADAEEVSGTIRLGLFLGFPRVRSRELLLRFSQRHPQAAVRVVHAPQQDLEQRLRKNRLDFVLSFAPRSATATDLVSTRLFAQELVLVSSARHFRGGFSLSELARIPVVDYYQSDPLIVRWLGHHFAGKAVTPTVRFWAATTDLVLDLIQSGAGVGVLPRLMLEPAHPGSARPRREVERVGQGNAPSGQRARPRRAASASGLRAVGPAAPLVDYVWLNEPRGAYRDRAQRAFREVLLEVLSTGSNPLPAAQDAAREGSAVAGSSLRWRRRAAAGCAPRGGGPGARGARPH